MPYLEVLIGTPIAGGTADMEKAVYDQNDSGVVDDAEKVNGLTVETAVPSGAVFTDTVYDDTAIQAEVTLNTAKETNVTQKTVESFPTQETTAFTVADGSDRAWIDCDFAAETEVTITATSVTVIGEPVYFALSGDGPIKFIESGVTISFNADQSLIVGSKGDKIALMKTNTLIYEIV